MDADLADPGEAMSAVGGKQSGQAPGPLQGEVRLCLPVDEWPTTGRTARLIRIWGRCALLGRRACPRPHHPSQAHADHPVRMDGRDTCRDCPPLSGRGRQGSAPLGADNSAAETTRYEEVERPDMNTRNFAEKPQKVYWKYHIMAVLGLQIILAAMATPGNVNDINMLVAMLADLRRRRFEFASRLFHVDRGYDAEYNYWMIWMGMIPNIKQRKDATNRATPSRRKAAKLFDPDEYRLRALIEGIFGAEASRGHHLHYRFVRTDNRLRFAKGRAIT